MITSTSNAKIKYLQKLRDKSKFRREENVFLVEGRKMFEEAPRERIRAVYLSETYDALKQEEVLAEAARAGFEAEILSEHVFAAVSDTQSPQGVLCIVEREAKDLSQLFEKENGLFLFLEDIQDPGNLGTMVRTGEGAGVDAVIVSRNTVDLYNPKTIRSTMGSIYRVPVVQAEDLREAVREAKEKGVHVYAAHLKGTAGYDEQDYRQSTGFLIGNEGNGLTDETADLADAYIRIPMEGKVESLNAAISASLLMYEVHRQRK